MWRRTMKYGASALTIVGVSAIGAYSINMSSLYTFKKRKKCTVCPPENLLDVLPTRESLIQSLRTEKEFDVLVIGGGSAGAGCALDAQTRGLNTALVEYGDFCCGTSSKSSKLLHGGVKYLETALKEMDYEQYKIVIEGLAERVNVMRAAPHLSHTFPVLVPTYKWWQVIYYWGGIKLYDFLAGAGVLKPSRFVSKHEAVEICPTIKPQGLQGGLLYYDGQQNDARLVLSVILTAIRNGAKCVNHTEVVDILTNDYGKCCGVIVKDHISKEKYLIRAKVVINATGPFNDQMRRMADPNVKPMILGSSGIHIALPKYFCPGATGLINPKSSDGRVIFAFPWENMTIVGTTDDPAIPSHSPATTEKEIQYIIEEMNRSFSNDCKIRRQDVTSAWSGIRGLVLDPRKTDHKVLARNHVVDIGPSGLVTIAGGKLTTFRHMAEETLNKVVENYTFGDEVKVLPCNTKGMYFEGGHEFRPMLYREIVQNYGVEEHVAKHLCHTYGDKVFEVLKLCQSTGVKFPAIGHKLHNEFPFLEAEVRYACREYARTPADVLSRRTRLSLLNAQAAKDVLPKVVYIMAQELKWNAREQKKQYDETIEYLRTEMGWGKPMDVKKVELNSDERAEIHRKFKLIDASNWGYFSSYDVQQYLKSQDQKVCGRLVDDMVKEAGGRYITLKEFEKLYVDMKNGGYKGRRLMDCLDEGKRKKEEEVKKDDVRKIDKNILKLAGAASIL